METFADYGIDIPNRGGANRDTICPQCSSDRKKKREKCLSVNIDKGVWKCHHCGWKGGLKVATLKPAPRPVSYTPPDAGLPEEVLNFFASRGITRGVLERNKIGFGSKYMPQVEKKVGAVHFPYFKNGQVVNVKYRDRDKNFVQEAGAEKIVYGYDDIDPDLTIVVEGEMDKLALEVAGFTNTISVPDGAPAPNTESYSSKFDFLTNCEDVLRSVKRFILAVDNDAPGQRLEAELSKRLGRYKCARVFWPEGCKDANDTLIKHGIEKLADCIYTAEDYPIEGFVSVSDDALGNFYDKGISPGAYPGWKRFAEHYTVKPGEMTIVTGAPNSGKSEFLDAMLVNLATLHDQRFVVYSPENSPAEVHITKLVEKRVGKTAQQHYLTRMSKPEYLDAARWVRDHFNFINPEESGMKLKEILDMTAALLFRNGIDGLVIDPWNELDHDCPKDTSETLYISKCLSQIRNFARENQIHIWIVAHPTKLTKIKDKATGEMVYPPATPYDISGSAHWFNKADNCLSVFRPTGDNEPVTVFVQKIRFKTNGKRGASHFTYDFRNGRYVECSTTA